MRILNLLFSFTVGGTERLVTDVCNNLSQKGNDVHLFIVNDLVDDAMIDRLDSNIRIVKYGRSVGGNRKIKVLFENNTFKKLEFCSLFCSEFNSFELMK